MSDPSNATQKAIYTALSAALSPIKVYDTPPQNTTYPYVTIDSQESIIADPLASRRDERFVYLSVWSRNRGQKEVLDILSAIDSALHHARLSMESGRMVRCYVDNKRSFKDADNLTYHGAVSLRILTEH